VCSLTQLACATDPSPLASSGDTSETSTSVAAATTQDESPEPDTTQGTDTDSTDTEGTDTESTDTTGSEPDLPPEPICYSWDEAPTFEDLCFGPPVTIDPEPMLLVAQVSPSLHPAIYAGATDDHRIYYWDDLQPGGAYHSVPVTGTPVDAEMVSYFGNLDDQDAPWLFMIVTRDPHELVLIDFDPHPVIHTSLALDAEPVAAIDFIDWDTNSKAVALTDVDAHLHVFEIEMGVVSQTSTRMLPEPLETLDVNDGWIDGTNTQLLGRSNETLTAWFLSPPIGGLGPVDPYPFPEPISVWDVGGFIDSGGPYMLTITPGLARVHEALMFEDPGVGVALEHPVNALTEGSVPDPDVIGGLFGLSTADARIAILMKNNGEGTALSAPSAWIEVAPNCVSFAAAGPKGFVCASTSEGLVLISPE
jgi:hypothetical protein